MYTINYTPPPKETENAYAPLNWVGPKKIDAGEKPYFVGEVSELGQISNMGRFPDLKIGKDVKIVNTVNGNELIFRCYDIDSSDGGEDIAGWRFRLYDRDKAKFPCELLIIND